MDFLEVVIIFGLAAWRLASMIAKEHGPWDMFDRLRYYAGVRFDEYSRAHGTNQLSRIILCVWCSSVWFGIAATVLYYFIGNALLWLCFPLCISAVAIIVNRIVGEG